ncbi:hypothetical protein SELMODRAFT_3903, partial [Selaginella moellendorffii]
NPAIVKQLLQELRDAKQVNVVDKDGNTPLHTAVKRQNLKVIQALLWNDADPCQKNIKGDAPLHIAVKKGANLEVLKKLLYHVAEVDTPDLEKGQTLLHLAVLQMIKELELKEELHIRQQELSRVERYLEEELSLVEQHLHEQQDMIVLLIAKGADPCRKDKEGASSPLHLAVGQGEVTIVTALLEAGAEIDKKNKLGHTPLHYAVGQARADIARKLRDKGADFRLEDETGAGVLHFAARGGGKDIFALLDPNGPEVNRATKAGLTPLHFAA